MARSLRIAQTTFRCSAKTLINGIRRQPNPPLQLRKAISASLFLNRPYVSTPSPLNANILRILRTEIEYQSESAPPHQPPTKFNSFAVEDRPGEKWITMRRKFGDTEEIKIEVTMFDRYESVPKNGDNLSGEDVRLHISVLVDISKAGGSNDLEFLCSAWPDRLEVQKVYVLHRGKNHRMLAEPHIGPHFRDLNREIQKKLSDYLEARE